MGYVSFYLLGWVAVVCGVCVDDPSFNIGYGDCSTYAVGGRNHAYCASDGAVTKCLVACGSCGGAAGQGSTGSTGQGSQSGQIGQNGQCMVTSSYMCASGLVCKGTSSSMYGTCQPSSSSSSSSSSAPCDVYETWTLCGSVCEQKCGMTIPACNAATCNSPGCSCASGFARSGGKCVPQSQCQQQQQAQQSTPTATNPAQYSPNVNGVVGTQSCSTHSACGTQNYCFACAKCFMSVGYANSKSQCGSCYANPMAPLPSNCGPISACASRQDAIDGVCPNWGNSPTCGPNEVYASCASQCEPSCTQPNSQCGTGCAPGKCQCISGFRRLGTQCVQPYNCPATASTCGTNEVYLTCSSLCEPACGQQGTCPSICGPARCQCASGYMRMGSTCVLPYQCPGSSSSGSSSGPVSNSGSNSGSNSQSCGPNEAYLTCSKVCEPTCANKNPVCTTACGTPRCQCVSGTVRSGTQCISPSACPQEGSAGPPVATNPSAGNSNSNCPTDNCPLQCSGGRVIGSNGCPLCQCSTQPSQTDPCNPNPCPSAQSCVPLSFNCYSSPCQKYTCIGKTGGKPQGAQCVSSDECQSFNICYKGPFASMGLCLPGSG